MALLSHIKSSTQKEDFFSNFKLEEEKCLLTKQMEETRMGFIIRDKTASNKNIELLQLQVVLLYPLKLFICSRAVSPNSRPNTCVIHQSCVCVHLCVRVWSAVSALAISALIHQPPDSIEVTLCDIWGHFTFSSEGGRKGALCSNGWKLFHTLHTGQLLILT